jgi:DNA invertase Pin-like site-specific DNA recombinase
MTATAVLYLRVSTDDQAESGLGIEAQRTACRAAAVRLGLEITGEHVDAGLSGSKGIAERPALLSALSAVKRGGVLLVAKRDRVARDMGITLAVESELGRKGARLISAAGEGSEDDGIGGLILRTVSDMNAQIERMQVSIRTRAAMAEKKAKGERVSRFLPFGYTLAADGIHLVANDREQQIIAVVQSLRSDGMSYGAIATALDTTTPREDGRPWQKMSVKRMIDAAPIA